VTDDALSDLTLAEILTAAAEELDGLTVDRSDAATTWSVGGQPFAALAGDRAEFRLDPMVARAALRTPDTLPSARGADWVAFAPAAIDDPAIDRAEAWFLSGFRRALAPSQGKGS
jgi:acyl dehydratase